MGREGDYLPTTRGKLGVNRVRGGSQIKRRKQKKKGVKRAKKRKRPPPVLKAVGKGKAKGICSLNIESRKSPVWLKSVTNIDPRRPLKEKCHRVTKSKTIP